MSLPDNLLPLLVCPACHGKLVEKEDYLLCPSCALRFPVRDGVPVLLLSEAEKIK